MLAENLEEFRKGNQVIDEQPAWEGVQRGVLTAERARGGLLQGPGREPHREWLTFTRSAGQSSVEDPHWARRSARSGSRSAGRWTR